MSKEHLAHLDGWRGLAILGVLIEHFVRPPGMTFGTLGVDLFFVLSGLLMSKLLYERRQPLSEFYRRRFSRVIPVFLLLVPTVFGLAYVMGTDFAPVDFWATLTFTRSYIPGTSMWSMEVPVQHLWSLAVEEHSYVVLATITLIVGLRSREWIALFALALASFCVTAWYVTHKGSAPDEYTLRTEVACIYILLSAGYRRVYHRFDRHVQGWMPIAATLLASLCYIEGVWWAAKLFAPPFLLAFAINHVGRSAAFVRVLSWRPLTLLGLWSYSIYMWQQPISIYQDSLPVPIVLVFVVGIASYYLYEVPMRGWLNRLGTRTALPAQSPQVD